MSTILLVIIFFICIACPVAILYYQWQRVKNGEIEIGSLHLKDADSEPPITLRTIALLVLYIIKHTIQFIVVQISKIYFFIIKKFKDFKNHKNPKIAKVVSKIKIPEIPKPAKEFIKKTVDETKNKINQVRQDLAELEETIDKRVD